jgi:hypothetical protein
MASLFVDYLEQQPFLWMNAANNGAFCPWADANLLDVPSWFRKTSSSSVVVSLARCFPSATPLKGVTTEMVVLYVHIW